MRRNILGIGLGLVAMVSLFGLLVSAAGAAAPVQSPPNVALQPGASTASDIGPLSLANCSGTGQNLCLWKDSNYSGGMWYFNTGEWGSNVWRYVGDAANDQASSVYNNRSYVSYLAKDSPPGANTVCLPVQWATSNLSSFGWPDGSNMNDSVSAFDLLTITNC